MSSLERTDEEEKALKELARLKYPDDSSTVSEILQVVRKKDNKTRTFALPDNTTEWSSSERTDEEEKSLERIG